MITFSIGILILLLGYIFYSRYVDRQFAPDTRQTPALKNTDGIDFVPMKKTKNMLVQLLNIAGLGPILGAIQGVLFGPVAFIIIPAGCILMGGVHDYFAGMVSEREGGMQITGLIKKYLGSKVYSFFMLIICIMLILLSAVFVYTSGDLLAQRYLNQTDFSLSNPIIVVIYSIIILYFILATLFPIDKIIGRFYPLFALLLIFGTLALFVGYFFKGIILPEIDFSNLNLTNPHLPFVPMFFLTVSCGLLSGFHSTQSTIISRTITSEFEGRQVFFGMMCLESLITMIWAAGAMYAYNNALVPTEFIGKANAINYIADAFMPYVFTLFITLAVVILPITSGDTALRSLRLSIAEAVHLEQKSIKSRLLIILPILMILLGLIFFIKSDSNSFFLVWRYFNFTNQLIVVPTFFIATLFLIKNKKNYLITLLPALFILFLTMTFILNAKIGFNLPFNISKIIASILVILSLAYLMRIVNKCKFF